MVLNDDMNIDDQLKNVCLFICLFTEKMKIPAGVPSNALLVRFKNMYY